MSVYVGTGLVGSFVKVGNGKLSVGLDSLVMISLAEQLLLNAKRAEGFAVEGLIVDAGGKR